MSHWMTTRDYTPGPSLEGDIRVNVAVAGGGFTGLSPAFHLKKESPGMRLAILENEVIGFGASGRNAGFSMTLFGRTICDLVLENKTDLSDVFFVNRKTIPWPPELFKTLGVKGILGYMLWEDRAYDQGKRA